MTGWGAIDGGYYIEFIAKGFSNFFITKGTVPLPLKWLDVQGKLIASTAAAITWTVTEEKNVKGDTVQYSADPVYPARGKTNFFYDLKERDITLVCYHNRQAG